MACSAEEQIAVRFNYQKMAPLGIKDTDYRRVAMALDLTTADVESLCQQYRKHNKDVAAELFPEVVRPQEKQKVCFIGDSITSERTSYMNIIREAYENEPNVEFLDCAISGWQTANVIFEFEGIVPDFKPDIIHIMVGTNDARNAYPGTDSSTASLMGYRRNMKQIIHMTKALGAKVIISTVPPTKQSAPLSNGTIPEWETVAFNKILRELCAEEQILLNDMEAELTAELENIIVSFDHVHLNANGQKLMAASVYKYLTNEFAK